MVINSESWNEDNFAIAYLCKGLNGYIKNYQKKYYGLPRNKVYEFCECGGMFVQNKQNNRFKCDICGSYQPIGTKTIICIDCGEEKQIPSTSRQNERCSECYEVYRKAIINENAKKYYQNKK